MTEDYDDREIVGMDLRRRRSVLVRMTADGRKLETARITNSPAELRRQIARAGEHPRVVLEATYGWYWAADTLAAAGAEVHLAHPLGVKGFAYRRVKNDERDAADLADLLRMGRLPEAWVAPRHRLRHVVAGQTDNCPGCRRPAPSSHHFSRLTRPSFRSLRYNYLREGMRRAPCPEAPRLQEVSMHTPATGIHELRQVRQLARSRVTGGAFLALAALALLAAVTARPASASGIFVRSSTSTQPNEADLVTEGPNHSLEYYFATPGGHWHHVQVAGAGTTYSAPSIFVRAANAKRPNEADIVAEGPDHSLRYYFATPGGRWRHVQVAKAGTTYSAPSIFVRAANATQPNEADIVAEGPNHTLRYYFATPGRQWSNTEVAGPGTTYSAPSIFVRAANATQPNEADIVAEGPNHTLQYYLATPGGIFQQAQVAGAGTTYSAPSIFVRAANATQPNEADIVAEGPNHTLRYYLATPGSPWQRAQVARAGTTYSTPSIFVRAANATRRNEADIVAEGPNHTLRYYSATPGSAFVRTQVAGVGTTYSG